MFQKFFHSLKKIIHEEYKFILFLTFLYIIFTYPVNYYIIVGGGISNIDSRIQVEDAYSSKGNFYISYVSELQGRISTYLLSYIIPDWKRVSMDDYKYDIEESVEDIEFRNNLELKAANSRAILTAYELANKKYQITESKIYVTSTFDEYKTKLKTKDQIISIDGNSFSNISEYRNYLQTKKKKDKVKIVVLRDQKEKEILCPLYEMNNSRILGVSLQTISEYETDPEVNIQFKKTESGPSGGLMTTLDIYNKLTKEDITHGKKIAGTGTIEEDGSIGEIGEVEYKLLGAVKGGASIFLVPSGDNYEACKKLQKQKNFKIKIIPVKNIKEAIDTLQNLK